MAVILNVIFSALFMSFAWVLRGQFGHEIGAAIPGAYVALAASVLIKKDNWRQSFAQSVILSSLGFCLGGYFSFGNLISQITSASNLKDVIPQLIEIFSIGAIWGGLGMVFLGFGLSEKGIEKKDYLLFAFSGITWWATDLLRLEHYGVPIYGLSLLLIHLYNVFVKRSQIILWCLFFGVLGFGGGFLISVLLNFYGTHGHWSGIWWTLGDVIWGGIGGIFLMFCFLFIQKKGFEPMPLNSFRVIRYGFIFFTVALPAVETLNVYQKWFQGKPPINPVLWPAIFLIGSSLMLGIIALVFLGEENDVFEEPSLNRIIFRSLVFSIIYLAMMAILKSVWYSGAGSWQVFFTYLIISGLVLCLAAWGYLRGESN